MYIRLTATSIWYNSSTEGASYYGVSSFRRVSLKDVLSQFLYLRLFTPFNIRKLKLRNVTTFVTKRKNRPEENLTGTGALLFLKNRRF